MPSYVANDHRPKFNCSGTYYDAIYGDNGRSLVIQNTLFLLKTPTKGELLHTSIFHTTSTVKDSKCHLIKDGEQQEYSLARKKKFKLQIPT